jgi:peptidoglycan/LPS O-acetylase OafA/YrhL
VKVRSYIPELDGLRAFAITLVFLCHAEHERIVRLADWGKKGWLGVDLFFVISGFLITHLLLQPKYAAHPLQWFYLRRIFRIWPMYFFTLAFAFLVWRYTPFARDNAFGRFSVIPYLLLVQNLWFPGIGIRPLGVMWSLAIEEHFYLGWPWLVRALKPKPLLLAIAAGLVFEPCLRAYLAMDGYTAGQIYRNTATHFDGLLAGALLAVWMEDESCTPKRLMLAGLIAGAAMLPLVLLLLPPDVSKTGMSPYLFSAIAFFFAGIVALALSGALKFLASRPLVALGQLSYSMYLIHLFVFIGFNWFPERRWPVGTALLFTYALTVILAALTRLLIEKPFLRLKERLLAQ